MSHFKVITDTAAMLAGKIGYLQERHDLLTQNVAQIETPGYIGKELKFEGFFNQEREADGIQFRPSSIELETRDPVKANGNNVLLEQEIAKLTENSMEFMTSIETIKKNLAMMRMAVMDK